MSNLTVWLGRMSFLLIYALLPQQVNSQELKVRTEKSPYFVGQAIALEIDAVDFDKQPEIEIEGDQQEAVNLKFRNSGRSESTRIFQSGGKLVRSRTVKTTFYYELTFESPGEYRIGPFETTHEGKKIRHPAVEFAVKDVAATDNMSVEIRFPSQDFYPGQKVPVELRWIYAGDVRQVRGLTIRTPLFDRFRFVDQPNNQSNRGNSSLPISTAKGIQSFPAQFEKETIDGRECLVGTVKRTMVPDKPEKVELPPTFVSFQKVVGIRRSNDIFDSFFDTRPETVPMRGKGFPVKFEVKPFPNEGRPASFRGAVGTDFQISTNLNRTNVQTGDPLTLQINVSGEGNLESLGVPRLDPFLAPESFEWPAGEIAGVMDGNRKQFRVSLRIKDANITEIPPLEFSWFNPELKRYQSAQSAAIPLQVRQGSIVGSADVIGNERDLKLVDEPITSGSAPPSLDLAIETNIDRLLLEPDTGFQLVWLLYGLGLVGLGLVAVRERLVRSPKKANRQNRKSIRKQSREIGLMKPGESSIEQLVARLRELQAELDSESSTGDGGTENQIAQLTARLDDLIARCDAITYRPSPATAEEQQELLDEARQLTAGI